MAIPHARKTKGTRSWTEKMLTQARINAKKLSMMGMQKNAKRSRKRIPPKRSGGSIFLFKYLIFFYILLIYFDILYVHKKETKVKYPRVDFAVERK